MFTSYDGWGLLAIILAVISFLIATMLDNGKHKIIKTIFMIIGIIAAGIAFYKSADNYSDTHKTETKEIVIEIEDKYSKTRQIGIPGKGGHRRHEYYIVWDDNKVEVSRSVYEDYEIGDTIVITKEITYELQEDGKWVIVNIEYN